MSEVKFEPFQRVLVRVYPNGVWSADLFSHYENDGAAVATVSGHAYATNKVVSYEGNEHLLGTTDSPTPSEPEFKWGDKVEMRDHDREDWHKGIFLRQDDDEFPYVVIRHGINSISGWKYCRKGNW